MQKRVFVFVVCGVREHIDTVHFSLRALQFFSDYEIWVVTDSARNEIPVRHSHIIDVSTPEYFDHHQASIYLKTGLHKFLPSGNLYCYLDTDVVALSKTVNKIFEQKAGVVTFAPDHCQMHQFSPYALNCGCLNENNRLWKELNELLQQYHVPQQPIDTGIVYKQEELKRKFEFIKRNPVNVWQMAVRYLLPGNILQLDSDTFYNKRKKYWFDAGGRVFMHDYPLQTIKQIEKNSHWRWSNLKRRWISPSGTDIHQLQCNHLWEAINNQLGIPVMQKHWQHWNGGVFLFDDASQVFMETWHQKTLQIFKEPYWKTRDQGTLVATVWQLGLQHSPLLSKKFNFIADYSNPKLMLSLDGRYITDDAFATKYAPAFMHIFHQFGNKQWRIWDWVENRLSFAGV